jgi:hypothetical protein
MKIMTNVPLSFLNGDNTIKGGNYGNQVYWLATAKLLDGHTLLDVRSDDEPDMVVYSIANNIRQGGLKYMKFLSSGIEQFDCPKVMLSIGADYPTCEMYKFSSELKLETEKFLGQMDAVNLRGTYTRDLLRYNGIDGDFKALGCPAILLNKIPKIPDWTADKIILNTPGYGQCKGLFTDFVSMTGDRAMMLAQHELYGDYKGERKEVLTASSNAIWRDHLKGATFSIGTRIHGSIMSLLCGVPTMCMCIDSRTTELCQSLNIPYTIYKGERFSCLDELMNYARLHYNFDRSALDESVRKIQNFFDDEVGSRL